MKKRIYEILKTLGLLCVFLLLLVLVFYIPQNRQFSFLSSKSQGFLNLGKFLHIGIVPRKNLVTDDNGWVHLLVLGKPGAGNPAPELTDSIILASFKDSQAIFISIPRDLYVKNNQGYHVKVNSLNTSGYTQEEIRSIISQVVGKKIDYSVLVELELLKKITNHLGGINVLVKEDINDPDFPGPNYTYDPFYLEAGWRHLDGETVLKYVRTRYDQEGDFGRMKRQQQALASLKNKISNLSGFENFNFVFSLYKEFQDHIETDLSSGEIKSFWQKTKNIDIGSSGAFSLTSREPKILKDSYIPTNQGRMFVLLPKEGLDDYSFIHKYINEIYENF